MQDEIIVEELSGENGLVGRLILNRPQALNALTENMCLQISKALDKWENDPKIKLVIIKGAGEKAFCAGGDIRQVYVLGKEKMKMDPANQSRDDGGVAGRFQGSSSRDAADDNAQDGDTRGAVTRELEQTAEQPFFIAEYEMNKTLYHFKKPYFAFLNGITMGGGVGVSIHGSHRIATEKLRLAMPETAIGFYPDVGAGYHLVRCPKKFGWYLALTGNTITADEAMRFGLCTHFVPSAKISDLENALISTADEKVLKDFIEDGFPAFAGNDGGGVTRFPAFTGKDGVGTARSPAPTEKGNGGTAKTPAFTEKNSEMDNGNFPEFLEQENIIENIFSGKNLEEVLEKLEKHPSAFAQNTLETLRLRSPLSLKITWAHLKRCEQLSFDEVITENYVMTLNFLKGHDFFEGVRAQIIDKDKNPKWQPARLSEITENMVAEYFVN